MLLDATGLRRQLSGKILFDGVELHLDRGEILAVSGRSGIGKTQLLRLLAWLDPPDGGTPRLDGRTPAEHGIPTWRARVTYVAQHPPALRGTPNQHRDHIANLHVQRQRPNDDPVALAEAWGLEPDLWRRPWSELSGGERQRAYLAIAVAHRPDVLLLDEPTSSLDSEATAAVEQTLRGHSIIWVTHDAHQAERVANRTLKLGSAGASTGTSARPPRQGPPP